METLTKKCGKCKIVKSLEEFHRAPMSRLGRHSICKVCRCDVARIYAREHYIPQNNVGNKWGYRDTRAQMARRKGWPVADIDRLLKEKRCAICGIESQGNGRKLSWDHDHVTGHPRSVLCASCNAGLGHFRDDINLLRSAIAYLVLFSMPKPSIKVDLRVSTVPRTT